jgi:hypothetical protein
MIAPRDGLRIDEAIDFAAGLAYNPAAQMEGDNMPDDLKPAIDASLKALGQDMTAALDRKLRALATVPKVTHPELSDFPITIRVENTDKQITLSRAQALDVYRVLDALFSDDTETED